MPRSILLSVVVFLAIVSPFRSFAQNHTQVHDASFDAIVSEPAFGENPPRMLFDDAHENFHRSDGRYAPFVTLMRNDGIAVTSGTSPFDAGTLEGHDILAIVNAHGGERGSSAFTDAEIDAVVSWVERGGSLLLVADHAPFGAAANALSERFGVTMMDAHVKDEENSEPSLPGPFFLLFTRENGLLGDHAILDGRGASERVEKAVTFGGQALRPKGGADVILALAPSARIVRDLGRPAETEPAGEGAAAAVAVEAGRGRVVIVGEAAALTAQVITGDVARQAGVDELRVGMSRGDTDNKQLALNIVRWLARKL